jgi:cobalt-zinc-cadmium efflux system outer membrane protein
MFLKRVCVFTIFLFGGVVGASAQTPLTWEEVLSRFKRNNPNLLAGQFSIRENQANEVTANLRPNPTFSSSNDQIDPFTTSPWRPFGSIQFTQSLGYLVERRNKRELRTASARLTTQISRTDQEDLERQLSFSLRDAFIKVLQGKSVVELAKENLEYYDKVIAVNRERMKAGDIARVDLSRVELQRIQFESDLVNAQVNLRTAKIALLALVNDRTPVDQFDVNGQYDDRVLVPSLDDLRTQAVAMRPDLQSSITTIDRAKNDNRLAWANGSTDPTLFTDYTRAGPFNTIGMGFSIPLRVFDRNQGEKERTRLEIERSQSMRTSIEVSIYRDVDTAYATVESARSLLQPYRERYLKQAEDVRNTVSFSYARGAASLLEFLDAQKAYRDTQLNYRNLIAGFLSAVNQLNLAVGKEVTK